MTRPIYQISARPEAYEIWGEVTQAQARAIATVIARQASMRFPHVDFRVSDAWSVHGQGMNQIAAYIDKHWQNWAATVMDSTQAA
jgi:hypothetical protein